MFTSGLALLTKAGIGIPAVALVLIPLVLGLASYAILRRAASSQAASPAPRASATTCAADSSALSVVVSRRTSACSGGS